MAFYQILYWQEIPSQIKVWDDFDEIKIEMPSKFMTKIDSEAKAQGLVDEDSYLNQWKWSEEQERLGAVEEVAQAVKKDLELKFNT